jgi:SAM-dependent methyltransferase
MFIYHQYVVDFLERYLRGKPPLTILDYGCGAGEIVFAARKLGINIYGTELFYKGGSTKQVVEAAGALGTIIREISNGRIDFPDATFDFVLSNMVFEHVEDMDSVLREINRVLKPGGVTLNLFPSRDVWREGHCGIPFLHWFSKKSKIRYSYGLILRRLGLGYHKGVKTPEDWTSEFLEWLDRYCYYRDRKTIMAYFGAHFTSKYIEDDYIDFRLGKTRLRAIRPLLHFRLLQAVAKELFRRFGSLVILSKKANTNN